MKRSKNIISDNPSEDRGYSCVHRQTEGGFDAYARGERPITYWKKKTILNAILRTIERIAEDRENVNKHKIARTLRYSNSTVSDYLSELSKLSHTELQEKYLQFTGTHYTGRYFRYTKFYGIVSEDYITKDICNRFKSPVAVQLKLIEGENYGS